MLRREENFSKDNFVTKSFPLFTKKKTEHSFELSLFIGVFFRCIFYPELRNFVLVSKPRHGEIHEWRDIFSSVFYTLL